MQTSVAFDETYQSLDKRNRTLKVQRVILQNCTFILSSTVAFALIAGVVKGIDSPFMLFLPLLQIALYLAHFNLIRNIDSEIHKVLGQMLDLLMSVVGSGGYNAKIAVKIDSLMNEIAEFKNVDRKDLK